MNDRPIPAQPGAHSASDEVRRKLNALNVTKPIVSALIRFPGPASNHDQAVAAARAMVHSAMKTTGDLMADLGIEGDPSGSYRVMRVVSDAVSSHWRATSSYGTPDADVDHMRAVWRALAQIDLPQELPEQPADDLRVLVMVAVLEAMAPVTREIGVFNLFHKHSDAALHARDVVLSAAESAKNRFIGPGVPILASTMLFASLLRNAGEIYAAAWRRHAEEVVRKLHSLPLPEQEAQVEAFPHGMPLTDIDSAFAEAFDRLADMVDYLAPAGVPAAGAARSRGPGEHLESKLS